MISKSLRSWLRFSLISFTAFGIFWVTWYALKGSVPMVTEISLNKFKDWKMPIMVARPWLDMIGIPFLSVVSVWTASKTDKIFKKREMRKLSNMSKKERERKESADFSGIYAGVIPLIIFLLLSLFGGVMIALCVVLTLMACVLFIVSLFADFSSCNCWWPKDEDEKLQICLFQSFLLVGTSVVLGLVHGVFLGLLIGFAFSLSMLIVFWLSSRAGFLTQKAILWATKPLRAEQNAC